MEKKCVNCLFRLHESNESCRDLRCLGLGHHNFYPDTAILEDKITMSMDLIEELVFHMEKSEDNDIVIYKHSSFGEEIYRVYNKLKENR